MRILILSLALCIGASLQAQKLSTRQGYVKFFSDGAVEDIEAENKQVSSIIDVSKGNFAFLVPIKAFQFEKALMQEHFNENYMESGKFPSASFKGSIVNFEDIDFSKDGTYQLTLTGTMTIHGETMEITEEVTLDIKEGKSVIRGEFGVKASDYGIKIPAAKSDNISNDLLVTVNFSYA
jgi:hypothetical protein